MSKFLTFSFIILILVSLLFVNGCERKCKSDSDCVLDDCCNPQTCVLKERGASGCGGILICNEVPEAVSCECVEGSCVIRKS